MILLQEITEESKRIADPIRRLQIRIQVADLLWALDEPEGRRLFQGLIHEIARMRTEARSEGAREQAVLEQRRRELFGELLRTVIRRDRKFAVDVIERLQEDEVAGATAGITRRALYQEVFGMLWDASVGESSPQVSLLLDVAGRILSPGSPIPAVVSLALTSSASGAPQLGDALFRLVLSRFPLPTEFESSFLAVLGMYLSRRFRGSDSLEPLEKEARSVFARVLAHAEFLWQQVRANPAQGAGRENQAFILSLNREYLPLFQRFEEPARAAAAMTLARALADVVPTERRPSAPTPGEGESLEDRLRRIEREPRTSVRDQLLRELALAVAPDEGEQVAEKITDAKMREVTVTEVRIKRIHKHIADRQFEDAERMIPALPESALRSRALIEIARAMLRDRHEDTVRMVLEKAWQEAWRASPTPRRAECLFEIASLYAGVDSSRAYQILLDAVKAANEATPEERLDVRSESFGRVLYMPGKFSLTYRPDLDQIELPAALMLLVRGDFQGMRLAAWGIRSPALRSRFLLVLARWLVEEIQKENKRADASRS
ncbi:hypothetical protein HRbin10_01029 [bacterium HR10]|uniref:Uncharacterized protein n=1 Tax=uncultured Acidobacteriota bacterium TaxID=171953 RepID=H5SH78_9BACT|nr:hypothetical protein HGMM_F28D03C21 [uncultured Acidobacteriota bacterium]GBC81914.1 hypothetical protein HRbin10_01029 [bacterium HR10]